jgi:phosphoribosyl-ATP pyrophosphohydrolase|tara:strand:- start:966 stop:1295 length:330 start_codon:yes stop_codon:yes gene_type:complete
MEKHIIIEIAEILERRKESTASSSYTKSLFDKGLEEILSKISEESEELIEAAKDKSKNKKKKLIHETADLWFHTMVLLSYEDISAKEILDELEKRFGTSGLDEKASRKS